MIEGNDGNFLASDHALGYLVGPMYKNISWHLLWTIHLVPADILTNFQILHISPLLPICTPFAYKISLV